MKATVFAILLVGLIAVASAYYFFFNQRTFSGEQVTQTAPQKQNRPEPNGLSLTSPAFKNGGRIPTRYTCDGESLSPPLIINHVPENTKSLVLIMEDPDVPPQIREDRLWNHWVVYNIPPEVKNIPEGQNPPGKLGKNSNGSLAYTPPCPPPQYEPREHRYFLKLLALDKQLDIPEGASKTEVLNAAEGHVIAETELMGKYSRK